MTTGSMGVSHQSFREMCPANIAAILTAHPVTRTGKRSRRGYARVSGLFWYGRILLDTGRTRIAWIYEDALQYMRVVTEDPYELVCDSAEAGEVRRIDFDCRSIRPYCFRALRRRRVCA